MKNSETMTDIDMVVIIKFEMKSVRANIILTAADKNAKIKQLKLLAPDFKDWEGLDEPVVEKMRFNPNS